MGNSKRQLKKLLSILTAVLLTAHSYAQKRSAMKLNAGIITPKIAVSKAFYTDVLGFGVTFENEFYLLLHTPGHTAEISFLLPDHPSQQPVFQRPFGGEGMYLTIEVEDVDKVYNEMLVKGIEMKISLRDEPWGDRHFAIQDPNGIGIDIVQYAPPEEHKDR